MGPLRNYRLPDGTTRQYREGEQPSGSALVEKAVKQTPEERAARAAARRKKAE
jgi:hypothetical protein